MRADIAGTHLSIHQLELVWGDAVLDLAGSIADDANVTFALSAPRLDRLLPEAQGALAVEGRLEGPRNSPRLDARVEAESLAYAEQQVARLAGGIAVDPSPDGPLDIELDATGLAAGNFQAERLAFAVRGSIRKHDATLLLESDDADLDLALAGGLADSSWTGEIRIIDLRTQLAGDWQLNQPAPVAIAPGAAAIDSFCLRSPPAPPRSTASAWPRWMAISA
jgi:translocation and assembly module TamB